MARSRALYRDESQPTPRSLVAVDAAELTVYCPGGGTRRIELDGMSALVSDAASRRRFVRMLVLERQDLIVAAFITPPEDGGIAPRAVPIPEAPVDVSVLDPDPWLALAGWVSDPRLYGRTVGELAELAMISTAQFAIAIGEAAAQVAIDLTWAHAGPLRGGVELDHALRPLHEAARSSSRAADALVAAHAYAGQRVHRRAG